jgi:hypothetical protein
MTSASAGARHGQGGLRLGRLVTRGMGARGMPHVWLDRSVGPLGPSDGPPVHHLDQPRAQHPRTRVQPTNRAPSHSRELQCFVRYSKLRSSVGRATMIHYSSSYATVIPRYGDLHGTLIHAL